MTRIPGPDPRELPAEPGARRGGAHRPRAAHRRPEPVPRARAHDRGAARATPAGRLPALHHRRRRHRPRRRRPRAQPHPALRRGGRARLPHRGPEAGREEVRPPGRQGARLRGRADQAPLRRALPARRHGGARASSWRAPTPSPRRSSTAAATSAISRSSSAPPTSTCRRFKAALPRHPAPLPPAAASRRSAATSSTPSASRVRRRRRLARPDRPDGADRGGRRRPREGRRPRRRRPRQGVRAASSTSGRTRPT